MAKQEKKLRVMATALSHEVVGALADKFDSHPITIRRWCEKRDARLTSDLAKAVLEKKNIELDLTER